MCHEPAQPVVTGLKYLLVIRLRSTSSSRELSTSLALSIRAVFPKPSPLKVVRIIKKEILKDATSHHGKFLLRNETTVTFRIDAMTSD